MQRLLVGLFRFLHPFLSAAELSPPVRMLYRGALYTYICSTVYIYMLYRIYIHALPRRATHRPALTLSLSLTLTLRG